MHIDRLVRDSADLRIPTDRLVLRRMREADLPVAIAHERDREIMRFIRDPLPDDELERRVRSCLDPWEGQDGQWLILVVEERASATMLGIVCLKVTVREFETVEIGYRLHPDFQRQGFGSEMARGLLRFLFEEIGVRKAVALCVAGNEASWRLMEALGMRREACLREHSPLGGVWHDELVYGLLRREFA